MLTAQEIRRRYLDFFLRHGHEVVPSGPLIPPDDPSLLFANAGMVQFKKLFLGEEKRAYTRAASCQKCLRVSGKHNDLENVGRTARHHTFFEMLGNFSFGDYFKREAIAWAWQFVTEELQLPREKLWVTVFREDDEAAAIWKEVAGLDETRIIRMGEKDNFWTMGDTGPCGPCSEIYIDQGEDMACGPDCGIGQCDCDRFLEIWNLVFTQFDQAADGSRALLAAPNIDTGMGLERIAAVCQGKRSNFDCDLFQEIIQYAAGLADVTYSFSAPDANDVDTALRVIADHSRAAAFLIAEGVLPSNENRGYVLRRLLRRAARHGKLLGVDRPFLYEVCATVIRENEAAYPDLREKESYITRVIRMEEESFAKTIDGGMRIFTEMLEGHKAKGERTFSGADAFKLYDTYGFPIDLTAEMVEEEGMRVDQDAFKALMEEQRLRARKAREALGDLGWAGVEFGKDVPSTAFAGYDSTAVEGARVAALVVENELAEVLMPGVEGIVVLDRTPFYAEMGGQVADHGVLSGEGVRFEVTDVQKNKGGKYMHYGRMTAGSLRVGDAVTAAIDTERRQAVMRAHTATHLLDKALRTVLGDHVHQAGSLVEEDYLRFDFTHFAAMTAEELSRVSQEVNNAVLAGWPVEAREMPIEEAKRTGAIALFSEKYGDVVRVVNIGGGYSVEFCGGTHLDNSAKAGVFHIDSEFSVASGVRRIEAVTGKRALEEMNRFQDMLFQAAAALKVKPVDLKERAGQMVSEARELRQTIEKLKAKEFVSETDQFLMSAKAVKGLKVVSMSRSGMTADDMRKMGDFLRDKEPKVAALLAGVNEEKITFLAVCGKEAVAKGVKAGDIIKTIAPICGGRGGGKPDSAMGGGSDLLKLDDALAALDDFVNEKAKD